MDPGNLDTDIQAGSQFGYSLIWVLVLASLLGLMVQTLATRLGVVTGKNLAQLCKAEYKGKLVWVMWILAELTVIASDIPEVIGTAIALKLLFGLKLWVGVVITVFSVILFLGLNYFGVRKLEFFIALLVGMILVCFLAEMFLSRVPASEIFGGLVPTVSYDALFAMTSLIGAVVMPHNLFLHSGLVQSRDHGRKVNQIHEACRYNFIESTIALGISIIINISVISVAAKDFYYSNDAGLESAPELLDYALGGDLIATILFAIALLASGQSSTMTGTLAGQYVMEGFVDIKVKPWIRAGITRGMAIIPSLIVALIAGEGGADDLIVFSQALLSVLLPFALIPLLKFTNSEKKMGAFVNKSWVKYASILLSSLVIVANISLVFTSLEAGIKKKGSALAGFLIFLSVVFAVVYLGFLAYLIRRPLSDEKFVLLDGEDDFEDSETKE
jgi:NRAMP (natural resistance-associated macrophage protein)-like metal ion transporter